MCQQFRQAIGVVAVFSRRAAAFDESHLQTLKRLAADIPRSAEVRSNRSGTVEVFHPITRQRCPGSRRLLNRVTPMRSTS